MLSIKDSLQNSCKQLDIGELILADNFELYDAMSCIEIMNPKMDTGLQQNFTFSPNLLLDGQKRISFIDHLFAKEMQFLNGNLLSQTIYTCYLFHENFKMQPNSLQDENLHEILNNFKAASKLFVNFTNEIIVKAVVYHEEDFQFESTGLDLTGFPNLNSLKKLFAKSLAKINTKNNYDALLINRIQMKLDWLQLMAQLNCDDYKSAKVTLSKLITEFQKVKNTLELEDITDYFDHRITLKTFANSAPRPILNCSTAAEFESFQLILDDFEIILNFYSTLVAKFDLKELHLFLHYFSRKTPASNCFVHSVLMNLILYFLRNIKFKDYLKDSIKKLTSPLYTMIKIPEAAKEKVDFALTNLEIAYSNYITVFCKNSARTSRNLLKIVKIYEQLQQETETVDDEIHELVLKTYNLKIPVRYDISCWIYNEKLFMLTEYFEKGFRLEVYNDYELPMIFWYIIFIQEMHCNHLNLIENMYEQSASGIENLHLKSLQLFLNVKLELRKSLLLILVVLEKKKLLKKPKLVNTLSNGDDVTENFNLYKEKLHFENRFKIFNLLGSPVKMGFNQYVDDMEERKKLSIGTLFELSLQGLQKAITYLDPLLESAINNKSNHFQFLEYKKELFSLKKVCIANQVKLNLILNNSKLNGLQVKGNKKKSKINKFGNLDIVQLKFESVDWNYSLDFPVINIS
ncbi:N-alpha-acetyltransferase 35 NatC auxiliary subunit [Lobulomyces angularis]|nr:N-alpha-acetyltransferase 35 NatC auxiliary subunit [Lobulomyces angularis]